MDKKKILKKAKYFLRILPDRAYIQLYYFVCFYHFADLKNPKTYNEKINWLKLYDKNPQYTKMVDKYEVKAYVASVIGEEYIIPTLGVWDNFNQIDFEMLPNQFVLKCTHDSGGLVIVKDKSSMNLKATRKIINEALSANFYYIGREWPYKNVKPRIIAEKYMEDLTVGGLLDYKVFNFDGKAKIIQVDYSRFAEHKRNLYTINWEYIKAEIKYPTDSEKRISRPKSLEKMIELSERLSKGIPHVRTDFYIIDNKIYFGELTFYHGSGFEKITPVEFGNMMGEWIQLPIN